MIQHFAGSGVCEVTALIAATLTLVRRHRTLKVRYLMFLFQGKTVLYGLIEAASGFHHTSHNNAFDLYLLYALPNGLWIVMPGLLVITLARRAARRSLDKPKTQ